MRPYRIAVIALLKPSQVKYKISPLLRSEMVSEIILFRKTKYQTTEKKLTTYVLPNFMSYKCFYWTLTPFYIAYKLRKAQIDLLLTYRFIPHTYYTWVVSRLLKKPFIYSQIDEDVNSLHKTYLGKFFVEHVLESSMQINVPGVVSKQYWSKVFPYKAINILHSTINTDEFKYIQTSILYDFIYVGVLTELKRVLLLIKAIEYVKMMKTDVKFAVVGYGPLESELKAYVSKHDLTENIVFLGKRDVDSNLLCSAKIFTMASTSEGLPCALMEAMASELLCVSTEVGNIPDVIKDGKTGYIFHSTDPQYIGDLLTKLICDYDKYRNVRLMGREHIVSKHSFISATKKWDRVLEGISL